MNKLQLVFKGIFLVLSGCCTVATQENPQLNNSTDVKNVVDKYYREVHPDWDLSERRYSQKDAGSYWITQYDAKEMSLGAAFNLFIDKQTGKVFKVMVQR